ncbi:MAG: glycosyltransferase family 4 protein [Saprospiraceae bacterium]
MIELFLGFLTAFGIVLISTPVLIKVAKIKHLVDDPTEDRKIHHRSVPTIGGIMIFAGTIISYALWFPSPNVLDFSSNYSVWSALEEFKYLVACMFILFFMGVKDDIIGMSPSKKLFIHIVVAIILVVVADIRISNFQGLFNLETIPESASIILSIFSYIVIVNAINLIDGVDGLAAGVGAIAALAFACWFFLTKDTPATVLALALAGALTGFLVFNFSPAKIFMGDSGSLIIGLVLYVMAVRMIEFDTRFLPERLTGVSKPVLAMAILCYPLIDTLRVFVIRILKGKSPFSADKNHIHHKLLSFGFSHKKTVFILYIYAIFVILLTTIMPSRSPNIAFLIVGCTAYAIAQSVFFFKSKK